MQSVLNGIPLFRSASGADSEGYSNNGFMNTIHELFQRAQEQQHGPPLTSKPFLDKVPVKVWTQEMEKTENQRECKDDTIISLPCGHTFHKGCGLRWLLEHNVCPTCRYHLPIQTEVSTSQSEQPTTSGTIAGTEPEQEPSMPDTTLSVTGVRRQRPTETFRPREVRQRVNEPAPVDDVVDLDFMLKQEADRFMKEEIANSELLCKVLEKGSKKKNYKRGHATKNRARDIDQIQVDLRVEKMTGKSMAFEVGEYLPGYNAHHAVATLSTRSHGTCNSRLKCTSKGKVTDACIHRCFKVDTELKDVAQKQYTHNEAMQGAGKGIETYKPAHSKGDHNMDDLRRYFFSRSLTRKCYCSTVFLRSKALESKVYYDNYSIERKNDIQTKKANLTAQNQC
ncbi:hypothetical protein PsorP6_002400 [Peronosclerospora sorghi]|uniref:Uncharacterized protein n=1 Tax=Peronosclerospora sorghi TaxID=230839 RepID=A0ACC0WQ59_9STRA|nr:hypothetical protein PsorP6_002400 [Peronosclerospora sorghi]